MEAIITIWENGVDEPPTELTLEEFLTEWAGFEEIDLDFPRPAGRNTLDFT
jgi:hypothetical protein